MGIPVDTDGITWKVVASGLCVIVTGLFSWFGLGFREEQKTQNSRIDAAHARLDATVTKEDFREALATFRVERDAQHKDNKDERVRLHEETLRNFKELSQKIDTQAVQDQRILQLERELASTTKYADELKHLHIDPYERAVATLDQRVKFLETNTT